MKPWSILLPAALLFLLAACSGGSKSDTPQPQATTAAENDAPVAAAPAATPEPVPTAAPAKTRKVVVLDPGHGGDEIGAARNGVTEKESNLDFALRVEKLLVAQGIDVVLTRDVDKRAADQIAGFTATRSDLQARIDLANKAGGDVFVSIHSNGSDDTSQKGVEAWYDSSRAFAAEGKTLADLLVRDTLRELRTYGYDAQNRGLFDGACFRQREGRCFTLFVIAGPRMTTREEIMRRGGDPEALGFAGRDVIYSVPANMPAALVELLIITNPSDAAVLRDSRGRDAMAKGVADAILEFLALPPSS